MGLWNGTGPSLLLVSNPVVQFVVYERVRATFSARAAQRGTPISTLEFFFIGAVAKAVATIVTYPVQLAQSRLRAMKKNSSDTDNKQYNYSGTLDVLVKVIKNDGPLGLFRGIEAKLWQTVLTAAFQFTTYERIVQIVRDILLAQNNK